MHTTVVTLFQTCFQTSNATKCHQVRNFFLESKYDLLPVFIHKFGQQKGGCHCSQHETIFTQYAGSGRYLPNPLALELKPREEEWKSTTFKHFIQRGRKNNRSSYLTFPSIFSMKINQNKNAAWKNKWRNERRFTVTFQVR